MTTLLDSFQAEFTSLDTSLLAALIADIERDTDGNTTSPTSEQIATLRGVLTELAAQAEQDEFSTSDDLDVRFSAQSITTDETPDFYRGDLTTTSSSESSGSSQHSFSSPLGFLQAALPHIPTAKLSRALSDAGGDDDVDMEAVIERLLTNEYIQELEERGLGGLDSDDVIKHEETGNSWETVSDKKKTSTKAKAGKRKTGKATSTIALADIRQQHHILPRRIPGPRINTTPSSRAAPAPDPWTQLSSLSAHLATLLPPHSAAFFQSYFHDPKHKTPAHALRAAITSMSDALPDCADPGHTAVLFGIFDVLRASPSYDTLSSDQRARLLADGKLALLATKGRGEDALDLIWLLHELDSDFDFELGVYHSPAPPPSSPIVDNPWITPRRSSSPLPTGPPPVHPPPISKIKPKPPSPINAKPRANPFAWQTVPPRPPPSPGVHPLAASIPAYSNIPTSNGKVRGSGNGFGKGGKGDVGELGPSKRQQESMRKRDELLREAGRAWVKGSKKTRGGEVALYYAERAREFQELAKQEALNSARHTVESKRISSPNRDTIDLHGTTVFEAIVIVKEVLHREGASPTKPLKIITGRGTHSAGRVGVLKPAIKSALIADGWSVGAWDGGLVVRGKGGRHST